MESLDNCKLCEKIYSNFPNLPLHSTSHCGIILCGSNNYSDYSKTEKGLGSNFPFCTEMTTVTEMMAMECCRNGAVSKPLHCTEEICSRKQREVLLMLHHSRILRLRRYALMADCTHLCPAADSVPGVPFSRNFQRSALMMLSLALCMKWTSFPTDLHTAFEESECFSTYAICKFGLSLKDTKIRSEAFLFPFHSCKAH